jgi:DNA polymerase alpha-associated DNA helicase A
MERALIQLKEGKLNNFSPQLLEVLFGLAEPFFDWKTTESICFNNQNLNESQKEAVKMALAAKHVALIHGPPGSSLITNS